MENDVYVRALAHLEQLKYLSRWARQDLIPHDAAKLLRALLVERQSVNMPDYCESDDVASSLRREDRDAADAALREFVGGSDAK